MKNILVAVDDTTGSRKAAEFARELAQRFGAHLTLLNVIEYYPSAPLTAFGLSSSEFYEGAMQKAKDFLHDLSGELGLDEAEQAIEMGNPGDIICTQADVRSADHIVLGSHGPAGLSRLVLGSVSARVASLATRPVTIVR